MEVLPATPEQIAIFKKAAAARYLERGVDPKVADQLFNAQLNKIASELGVQTIAPERVEKAASALATAIGKTRKTA